MEYAQSTSAVISELFNQINKWQRIYNANGIRVIKSIYKWHREFKVHNLAHPDKKGSKSHYGYIRAKQRLGIFI